MQQPWAGMWQQSSWQFWAAPLCNQGPEDHPLQSHSSRLAPVSHLPFYLAPFQFSGSEKIHYSCQLDLRWRIQE